MALTKQNLSLPFGQGVDTKTDPWQVSPGKFQVMKNSVFTKGGLLGKRNAFAPLTPLPSGAEATTLTTFKGNLTAIGNKLYAYNNAAMEWEDRGRIQTLDLSVEALVRNSRSQAAPDVATTTTGLSCAVFLDADGSYKYQISDSNTGQILVSTTNLPATSNVPRAFTMPRHFVITFIATVAGTPHLQYIAIPFININNPSAATDISTQVSGLTAGYDAYVSSGILYVAWDGNDGGGAIRVTYIDSNLTQHNTVALLGHTATRMSVTTDTTVNTLWVTAYAGGDAYSYPLSYTLGLIGGPYHTITTTTSTELTSTAQNSILTLFYQVTNSYTYTAVRSDFIRSVTCTQSGTVGASTIILRSVGLASKAFLLNGTSYMLSVYAGAFQPTYFLIDGLGNVIAKLAYSNGSGYLTTQVLAGANVDGNIIQVGYLLKDLIQAVNKNQNPTSTAGVYANTGVNLATFDLSPVNLSTVEIGNNLHIAGGFLWMYDGDAPVEHNFHLWAEDILATPDTMSGSMTAQQYFYQVVYEWTDAQGNIHRGAPSIPVSALLAGTGEVVLNIPTLRLTYKVTPNQVRIVIYRWSTAQQNYYQVTSVSSPILNNPAVDSITYTDTQADSSIIGNNIIYTTGGVVENIAAPATSIISLYKSRLMLVDAEDRNLIWYSKQVIESTPVEMSDLFTIFVAPTSGAQGSTGEITAAAPLDDKFIPFKENAIYYITGNGPDNTGANNDFSEPVFITATVGCEDQQSIVFTPQGLLFRSDKGIWLLGRDLSTQYTGAPVEAFNGEAVISSINVPGQNQVRFTLESGTSSTLYQGLHTVLNDAGDVLQETPDQYVDGNLGTMLMFDYYYGQWGQFEVSPGPVLLSFVTSWINLSGLQGFQRAYFFYLLGRFLSPHKISVNIAYDYNDSPSQSVLITPDNYGQPYGNDPYYGTQSQGGFGGPGDVEQWRVFFSTQKCQSFQLSISEVFDNQYSTVPGAGLTLSGLNMVVGLKKSYVPIQASRSAG